jgi:hypothetical protein
MGHHKGRFFKIALLPPPRSFSVFCMKEDFGADDVDASNAAEKVIIYA